MGREVPIVTPDLSSGTPFEENLQREVQDFGQRLLTLYQSLPGGEYAFRNLSDGKRRMVVFDFKGGENGVNVQLNSDDSEEVMILFVGTHVGGEVSHVNVEYRRKNFQTRQTEKSLHGMEALSKIQARTLELTGKTSIEE